MSHAVPPPLPEPPAAADLAATMPSIPAGPPSLPGAALWSDSDGARPSPAANFSGLVPTAADLVAPTIGHIGRYALKYELGSGGLGTVFAAHDPLLSRLIAVKTLKVHVSDDEREAFNTIFINEARAAGGLSHPHIVTVFDAGIGDENRAYIAMELLKGRDLRQLMQEGWRATPAQAALIVRRVADALAYAHSKGVIHRDIKPANIFMVGRTQPRVLDFGIARVTHRHESDTNQGAGSPYYMAPEQVRREPADRRADVFSLGVVLYELLTARKPFSGGSLEDIADAVQHHEPPLASKADRNVPRALAEIVAKAMEKDPDRRFRSARSFARELRQWLDADLLADGDGEAGAPAPQPQPLPPQQQPRQRVTMLAAGAAAATVAVAAIAAVVTWQLLEKPRPEALPGTEATTAATPKLDAAPVAAATAATASPSAVPLPGAGVGAVATATVEPATATVEAATAKVEASTARVETSTATVEPARVTVVDAPALTVAPKATAVAAREPVRDSARDRRDREREARALQARATAAATTTASPAAPPATGKVRIAVSPWGLVEVDGTPSGAAPPLTELTLTEGRHQIVIRNGDFQPFVMSVDVTAGQVTAVRHKFGS